MFTLDLQPTRTRPCNKPHRYHGKNNDPAASPRGGTYKLWFYLDKRRSTNVVSLGHYTIVANHRLCSGALISGCHAR